jgi:glycosyltransferase involved in cell wall biosynthesis
VLRTCGPYDVVHSHFVDHNGWILREAARCGVGVRIAHSHSSLGAKQPELSVARRIYFRMNQRLVRNHATRGLACSQAAAISAFGARWASDKRWEVLHCGINLRPFEIRGDRRVVRAELGIPADAFVVGHVGRFVPCKNHEFVTEVARETVRREPRTVFLLIGDGPLRRAAQESLGTSEVSKSVVFVGARRDVPRLLTYAMDAFVFPSRRLEGLGLAVIEAQASGLPCVVSDNIPSEADVVPTLIHRLSLSDQPARWAEELLKLRTAPHCRRESLRAVAASDFNIVHSAAALARLYEQQCGSQRVSM